MTTVRESAHARRAQPRPLIITIYGLHARDEAGWLAIGTLVRLLTDLGVDEAAVRSAVSRLKQRGLLVPRRIGATPGYALSPAARAILDEGDRRIFARRRADADEGWLLAIFSVPESHRHHRHLLRSRLTWLGYGTVSAGVRIAPAHVEEETRAVLQRDGLSSYVDLFRAQHLVKGTRYEPVEQWWDLLALQGMYDEFLTDFGPVLSRWRRRRTRDDAAAFTDHTRAVTAWRRLPFLDPGLPATRLPSGWPGLRAADLFFAIHERLADPAHGHVDSLKPHT